MSPMTVETSARPVEGRQEIRLSEAELPQAELPKGGRLEGEASRDTQDEAETREKPKRQTKRGKRNKELGRRGEEAAARFLDRRGYEIVARNWTCAVGEADIIARDGPSLVFVEVKTRTDCQKGFPSEAVTPTKREKYEKIACMFLSEYDAVDISVRFDVVSIVVVAPDRAFIRHNINAFGAAM